MLPSIHRDKSPEMIFMMGLPGAGKSTWVDRYLSGFQPIDVDRIKACHPAYDPKNPSAIHQWSAQISDRQFEYALAQAAGLWVVEGTGSNLDKMRQWMDRASRVGFRTGLIYITCTITTALSRNAERERTVPEHLILQKACAIRLNFTLLAPLADYMIKIDSEEVDYRPHDGICAGDYVLGS